MTTKIKDWVFNWNHLLGGDLGQFYIELLFYVGKKLDTLSSSEDWVQFFFLRLVTCMKRLLKIWLEQC